MMSLPPISASIAERVAMGARCRDCDDIPKVADAGKVLTQPDGQRVQIMHNGLKVIEGGYYGAWMCELIRLCGGHHEPQEERVFHEVLRHLGAEARMIELGGFWAYYSLWFLQDHPERRAVVLEPDPKHLDVGRANARLNDLAPVFLHAFAGGSASAAEPFTSETGEALTLPRHSVESLMSAQGWDGLELLHCDIQGAEVAVLEGCRPLLMSGRIDWVVVSTHSHHITGDPLTHMRCLEILRDCGATVEATHDVHESFSGDGLIVARFCPAPEGWVAPHISNNRHGESLFRHLAYDLHACQQEAASHPRGPAPVAPLSPDFTRRGELFELTQDGPLGQASETLLLPSDAIMAPTTRAEARWEYGGVCDVARRIPQDAACTLVDIGADIGLFTRQLTRLAPQIERVLCVEPDRQNFAALRYNLGHLQDRVQFFNHALGAADGTLEFFRDTENIGNYSLNKDAVRNRAHDTVTVPVRRTTAWMEEHLAGAGRLVWKSDTQGFDELIVAATPMDIWRRIDVALIELWRIAKPDFDADAFVARLEDFPNRSLGERTGASVSDILGYLASDDWAFSDLLLWR